ncbi:unnamed protein product, partial [Meganyctiphanes norvegica]
MDCELCEVIIDGALRHEHVTQEEYTTAIPQISVNAAEGVTGLQVECSSPDLDESFGNLDESFGSGNESFYSTRSSIKFKSFESLVSQSISTSDLYQNSSCNNLYTSALSLPRYTPSPTACDNSQDYPRISHSQQTLYRLPGVIEQNKYFKSDFKYLSASMSTLPRTASSLTSEDGEKKKKGLISSFRKSRKSSRKVQDQKHSSDISLTPTYKTDKSDGEQDSRDSGSSTPTNASSISYTLNNSLPNISKSMSLPRGKGIVTNLTDPVQGANIERLNGNMVIVKDGDFKSNSTASLTKVDQKKNKQSDITALQKNERATKTDKSRLGTFLRKEVKRQTPEIRVEPSNDYTSVLKEEKGIPKIKRASSSSPRPDNRNSSVVLAPQKSSTIGRASSATSINSNSEASSTDSSFRSYIQTVELVKKETKVKTSEIPNLEKPKESKPIIGKVTSPATIKMVDPNQKQAEKSLIKSEAEKESSKSSSLPKEENPKTLPVDKKRPGTTLLKPLSSEVTRKRSNGSNFIS